MAFGRLHEEARKSPKLLALSDAAWRMWGSALIYAQDELTDGFVPEHAIHTFGVRAANKKRIAEELCASPVPGKGPLWVKVDGGYQIHDYLDWNLSRDKILALRAKAEIERGQTRERVQRLRERRTGDSRAVTALHKDMGAASNGVTNGVTGADVTGSVTVPPQTPPYTHHDPQRNTHPARVTGGGVAGGTLPREHLNHAFCGDYRKCVPVFLHGEFIRSMGGAPERADETLLKFYASTMAAIPADAVISDDACKFWRPRFAAAFPSTVTSPVTPGQKKPASLIPRTAPEDPSVWVDVKGLLRTRINRDSYQRWFASLRLMADQGQRIVVAVPNDETYHWIQKHYLPDVAVAANDLRIGLSVDFVVNTEACA